MYKYYGSSVWNFRFLSAMDKDFFLWVYKASNKESWRTFFIPEGSLDGFGCQEWHIQTLRNLCAKFQASRCIGGGRSPVSLQSILPGVLEDILDSWMESRWLWTSKMRCINITEVLSQISGSSVHWTRIFSYESPERPPRSLGGHSWFLNGVEMTLNVINDMYKS